MTKKEVTLIVGEDADLPKEFIDQNKIKLYDFGLSWEPLTNKKEIYKIMRKNTHHEMPKTSQPSSGVFKEIFQEAFNSSEKIVVLTISSKLSGCYNSALQARESLEDGAEKIKILESSSASGASAFIVRYLIEAVAKKISFSQISEEIDKLKENIFLVGMIEDPIWLEKGGRISPAVAMIIRQMQKIGIRPLFAAKDGKISLLKVRTHAKDKVQALFEYLSEQMKDRKAEIIITHTDNEKEALELQTLLHTKDHEVIYIHEAAPVLGAHLGPDALIVSWKLI